jgi:hypothetical protein
MKTYLKAFAAVSVLLIAHLAQAAAAGPLSGEQIKTLIGGKQVYLSTPIRIELPLYYGANGSVTGNISGFSMASMFAPKETGRWWVEGSKMCQQFPTWYKGKRFCFTIEQTGANKIAWTRDDGYSGKARIVD